MNKLFLKLSTLSVGLMLAVGAGALISNGARAQAASAESKNETITCNAAVTGSGADAYISQSSDNFTVTQTKGTSSNNVAYTNPWRVYSDHLVTFTSSESVETITSVEITATSNSYATAVAAGTFTVTDGDGSLSASASSTVVTISVTDTVTAFTYKHNAQTRWSSIKIYYEKSSTVIPLQSIEATCDTVKVSQKVKPSITFNPSGASDKELAFEIVENTSDLASVDENGFVTGLGAGTARLKITPHDTNASAITIDVPVEALPEIANLSIGTKYAVTNGTDYEMTGMENTSTNHYGIATSYSGTPAKTFPVEVVNGLYKNTVAFKVSISSATKYLSYDTEANTNSLNFIDSIDDESSWISAIEDETHVIRNVADYTRRFCYNSQNTRFACYLPATITANPDKYYTPTFVEIPEEKTDAEIVQSFVDNYMHMDYTENLGYCKDQAHDYYHTAKPVFNALTQDQRDLFCDDKGEFADAYARLKEWARINGEAFNESNILESNVINTYRVENNDSAAVVIVIVVSFSLLAASTWFILRKKKLSK